MKLVVHLHPVLRAEIAQTCRTHSTRHELKRVIIDQALAVIRQHGPEITYAPLVALRRHECGVSDESRCAMSAYQNKYGVVVIEIDPLGTGSIAGIVRRRLPTPLAKDQRVLWFQH